MESNFWGIVAWLIIPPAASLMFAGRLKGRSVLGVLPYPWFLPRVLYWCLVLSIGFPHTHVGSSTPHCCREVG